MEHENRQNRENRYNPLSYFLEGALRNFTGDDYGPAYRLLEDDAHWKELQQKETLYYKMLEKYSHMFEVLSAYWDVEAEMMRMYGNACYVEGLKEGAEFALWGIGMKCNDEYELNL